MIKQIALQQYAHGHMIGMRSTAMPLRKMIEVALADGDEVSIDFSGIEVTQSFVDELLGAVILRNGAEIMSRVVLKGCSTDTRGIVRFVAADHARQFLASNQRTNNQCHAGGRAVACKH